MNITNLINSICREAGMLDNAESLLPSFSLNGTETGTEDFLYLKNKTTALEKWI